MIYKIVDGSANFKASYTKSHIEIFALGVNAYMGSNMFKYLIETELILSSFWKG